MRANQNLVERYMRLMLSDTVFPPVTVRFPDSHWFFNISDGWHRTLASLRCGFSFIPVVVVPPFGRSS